MSRGSALSRLAEEVMRQGSTASAGSQDFETGEKSTLDRLFAVLRKEADMARDGAREQALGARLLRILDEAHGLYWLGDREGGAVRMREFVRNVAEFEGPRP